MLGRALVTPQTSPEGIVVRQVMVAEATDIVRELYLAIVVDGEAGVPMAMASTEGGVEIEVVAETNPEKIVQVAGDPIIGLTPYRARALARQLDLPDNLIRPAADLIGRLYRLFVEKDCTLVEINPLVITSDGQTGRAGRQDQPGRRRALQAPRNFRTCTTPSRTTRRSCGRRRPGFPT